ncbi:hypothetical protein B5M09_011080 [Aphanomyces astaci]|uniref:Uncharacterized protein n=1 Tax=Aphanomyces astaci TaxID=112090 RepID=A0A3R7YJY9_APHAT|nr:hypothetical protein B5M09_011080 [Aphanomyces astaci]
MKTSTTNVMCKKSHQGTHIGWTGLIGALATLSTTSIEAIPLLASILESLALPCSQHPDANQREFFWQRMEGRLMGIDSLVHVLGVNKLTSISSQLLAPPTKPAPKAFQSFQHTLAYVEAGALLLLFQSATALDTKTQPANALLLQAVLNVLWASHVSDDPAVDRAMRYDYL